MCFFLLLSAAGEVYLARAQLAMNPASFQPNPNAPTAIQAVKQLATYLVTEGQNTQALASLRPAKTKDCTNHHSLNIHLMNALSCVCLRLYR